MRVSKEAYTEAKSLFVERVLASAMQGRDGNQSTAVSDVDPDGR